MRHAASRYTGSGRGTVYRDAWVQALATNYGSQPHFYDMDNEMDIWGGTHRDVHPSPVTYEEIRDTYISEARMMPRGIRRRYASVQ